MDGLIARALEAIGPENARIDVTVPDESPPISVDAAQLEHALVNLLENALKFSPPGSMVEIGVETEAGEAIISVVDEGDGLSEDELEAVFEPFRRGSASPGRGGAGLGLAIAGGFAKANGGRLWAEPVPGRGACFRLALPASRLPERVTALAIYPAVRPYSAEKPFVEIRYSPIVSGVTGRSGPPTR